MNNSELTDLESEILRKFFVYVGRLSAFEKGNLDDLKVGERSSSTKGWMTEILPNVELQLSIQEMQFDWSEFSAGALLNKSILVGFVVFARGGVISAIEGYTYDEDWPVNIDSVEFVD